MEGDRVSSQRERVYLCQESTFIMPSLLLVDVASGPSWDNVTSWGTVAAGLVLVIFLGQRILEWDPALLVLETVWHVFVRAIPARLLLERSNLDSFTRGSSSLGQRNASIHAAKSDALQSVLHLTAFAPRSKITMYAPKGLGNWDNSCYQNSVLQSMSSLASFRKFLDSQSNLLRSTVQESSTKSLAALINELNHGASSSRYIWTPPLLKSMNSWQQQDAQEYFSKLIDAMEREFAACKSFHFADTGLEELLDSREGAHGTVDASAKTKSHPFEGLLAQRVGCVQCGYTEGLSLIPFSCVTLPLERSWNSTLEWSLGKFCELETIEGVECMSCTLRAKQASLQQEIATAEKSDRTVDTNAASTLKHSKSLLTIINAVLDEESFEEEDLLKRCEISADSKVTTHKTRQAAFIRAPQCLVLHLNRSMFDEVTFQQLKNYAGVAYPSHLNLEKWFIGSSMSEAHGIEGMQAEAWPVDPRQSMLGAGSGAPQAQYRLRAVVNHLGRHENGHYVAIRHVDRHDSFSEAETGQKKSFAHDSGDWWRISDETVTSSTEEEALTQGGAFMLFYERAEGNDPTARRINSAMSSEVEPIHNDAATESTVDDPSSEELRADESETASDRSSSWTEVTVGDEWDKDPNN